ncbi:MAG: hypothetical protein ACQERF_04975 [Actinomycetota bacterium]
MKLRTPWIVTGSLAALAAAGGIGAALAEPAEERELTPVTTRPDVRVPTTTAGSVTPTTEPCSPGSPALTAASPAVSPVTVSAHSGDAVGPGDAGAAVGDATGGVGPASTTMRAPRSLSGGGATSWATDAPMPRMPSITAAPSSTD